MRPILSLSRPPIATLTGSPNCSAAGGGLIAHDSATVTITTLAGFSGRALSVRFESTATLDGNAHIVNSNRAIDADFPSVRVTVNGAQIQARQGIVAFGGLKLRDSALRCNEFCVALKGASADLGTAADPGGNSLEVHR